MFSLGSNVRYFMCQHPVNIRKGIDSLFNLVVSESPMSPMPVVLVMLSQHPAAGLIWILSETKGLKLAMRSVARKTRPSRKETRTRTCPEKATAGND